MFLEFLEKVANFSSKANANRENNSFDHTHHQNSNGDSTSHHTANNDSNDSNPGKEYTPEQLEAVKRYYKLLVTVWTFQDFSNVSDFYVKSILGIQGVQNLPLKHI